jgi:hypothetical protein
MRAFGFPLWRALVFVLLVPSDTAAYIGPGAGLTVIGTVLGVIGALLLAIIGFVWYPVKRLAAKLRGAARSTAR